MKVLVLGQIITWLFWWKYEIFSILKLPITKITTTTIIVMIIIIIIIIVV